MVGICVYALVDVHVVAIWKVHLTFVLQLLVHTLTLTLKWDLHSNARRLAFDGLPLAFLISLA